MTTTPREYVTIISGQGFEFVLEKEAACVSKAIRNLLEVPGLCENNTITFEDIPPVAMDLVCQYMCERVNKSSSMGEFKPLKGLDPKKESDVEAMMELLLAADYLDC
eukprot:PhM_4_TR11551/c0_g1_i1/m.32706/K03872/TCEB1; transcription elongation factor B, polypeptide 1